MIQPSIRTPLAILSVRAQFTSDIQKVHTGPKRLLSSLQKCSSPVSAMKKGAPKGNEKKYRFFSLFEKAPHMAIHLVEKKWVEESVEMKEDLDEGEFHIRIKKF